MVLNGALRVAVFLRATAQLPPAVLSTTELSGTRHRSLAGTSVHDAVDGSPPTTAAYAAAENRRRAMEQVTTIGLDIAKSVFQVHGIDATGKVVLRRRLTRARVAPFFAKLAPCLVGQASAASLEISVLRPALNGLSRPASISR